MLSDEVLDKVVSRITTRIEQINTFVLKKIGEKIKEIGMLTPSDAYRLQAIIKYGGSYDKIVKELARITNLNVNDIYKIFEEVAKSDYQFAKQFYDYRNKKFIPYKDNIALQNEVKAIARQTAQTYLNMANSYAFRTLKNGRYVNTPLSTMYQEVIDKAILSVSQGQNTFQDQMYSTIKELASSGLKTIDYASGRSYRLDSAVRMNLKEGLRTLHNQIQEITGEEFGADGVEISVHTMSAIDHEEVQGRQFSKEEYAKLNDGQDAIDYKGRTYTLDHDGKNGYRPISTLNCYHYIFAIILGASEPEYTDKELEKIKQDNDKGFEYDGKHYTLYEGTQLQRNIELELRKAKDTQIMAKASGNMELVGESQARITTLNRKYKELLDASGLRSKLDRARVPGYKRIKVDVPKVEIPKIKTVVNKKTEFNFEKYVGSFKEKDIRIDENINTLDKELVERNLSHFDYLTNKYNVTDRQYLKLETGYGKRNYIGTTYYADNKIQLNQNYFGKKETLINSEKRSQASGWHCKVNEGNEDLYTITHEYGHAIENNYARKYIKQHYGINTDERRLFLTIKEDRFRKEIDKDIRDDLFSQIKKKEKLTITEIKNKYFSVYAKSKPHFEWFAETFAQLELGEQNALTEAMQDWLERNYK